MFFKSVVIYTIALFFDRGYPNHIYLAGAKHPVTMTSKAALLRSDHFTDQAIASTMTMQKAKEEIRQVGRSLTFKVRRPSNRLDVTLKRKKELCQILPHYISWPLLFVVGTACVALVSFHLWFTWHLQRKVEVLQSRVESLSTHELEDLRVQLRNLYDLYDGSAEMKNGHLGQLSFSERNQVNCSSIFNWIV